MSFAECLERNSKCICVIMMCFWWKRSQVQYPGAAEWKLDLVLCELGTQFHTVQLELLKCE